MDGLTEHLFDGVRGYSITVIYPGWTQEEVFCEEIMKARGRWRLLDLRLAVRDADGLEPQVRENLLLNIELKLEKKPR